MAAAIKQKTNVDPELIKGGGGIFDVVVDGKMIYCKHDTGRFPTHEEVLDQLAG